MMALAGYDVAAIIESALDMKAECAPEIPDARNPGIRLGMALGEAPEEQIVGRRDRLP